MTDVISDYQKWKLQGENLRTEARQAMASRFAELLAEAVRIAEEYRADFGSALKPPPQVTAFRFKASARPKAKKAAGKPKPAAKAAEARPEPKAPAKPDPKIAALQKKLATTKKKLEDAKAAGSSTRVLEDKIYEMEDDLRLATQPA